MDELSLFPKTDEPAPTLAAGLFANVAIERSLDRTLDYSVPSKLASSIRVGQRVCVPLGKTNKRAHGYVVALNPTAQHAKTKPIFSIDDERALVTPGLMTLALWMSRYYCTALGTVLESVIPSAVKKKVGLDYTAVVRVAQSREQVQAAIEAMRTPKRRAILARMLQLDDGVGIEMTRLAGEAGSTPATVRKLVRAGLLSITPEPDFVALAADLPASELIAETIPELNEDQRKVFGDLCPRVRDGGFSVNLLHGVTGSGKTEIYLRCIKDVVEQGRQAVVLVPEIALTPQTVRRFTARFGRVAILHSGLSASQRHRYWQQIAQGQADVVVGARSAIFAPVPKLGMIVVDEEHESSYKQDTAPRYNARDLAIKRGQIEGVAVVLGSATPSLESWFRAVSSPLSVVRSQSPQGEQPTTDNQRRTTNNYHLLSLPKRVRGLKMPTVELVDLRQEVRMRRGIHLISQRLEHLLKVTLEQGRQAILLLNRRGYANFVFCPSCGEVMNCRFCDVTMTYHRSTGTHASGGSTQEGLHTGQLHCHYCLAVNPLPQQCPTCGKLLNLFGLGTQRVEEELTRKFPSLKFARVDGDSMHSIADYEATLGRFARGEIQVMLGTQMIAKGLDYPNVTLVGVISGDTALALPDFRAAERTFQLITQVAGRAGRGDWGGRVVLQTFLANDRTIQAAMKQDYAGFAEAELKSRREVGLPPVTRMVRVVIRDQDLEKLHALCQDIAAKISAQLVAGVTMKGPMPCAINRIAGYHRQQILLYAPTPGALQQVLAKVRQQGGFAASAKVAVDVDPVSLL